jgi:hypothetical protein
MLKPKLQKNMRGFHMSGDEWRITSVSESKIDEVIQ